MLRILSPFALPSFTYKPYIYIKTVFICLKRCTSCFTHFIVSGFTFNILALNASPLSLLSPAEMQANERYFPNPYLLGYLDLPEPEITRVITPTALLGVLDKCVPRTLSGELKSTGKYDVYVGDAGLAALFYHLHQVDPAFEWHHRSALSIAQTYIEHALPLARHVMHRGSAGYHGVGYLCTPTGAFIEASRVYTHLGQRDLAEQCVREWRKWTMHAGPHCRDMEVLYGHAGLAYASAALGEAFPEDLLELLAENTDATFHGKTYLGAAHGAAGICTVLVLAGHAARIRPKIEALRAAHWRTRATDTSAAGYLVQWCHGVVGFGVLFIEAYRALPAEETYLQEAIKCGDIVFKEGILKKHVGLCHGLAGNAYLFLLLYQTTHDVLWLQRCLAFVQIGLHWAHGECDHPQSVWEGWGGLAWLMGDLLSLCIPGNEINQRYVGFPGYTDISPGYTTASACE